MSARVTRARAKGGLPVLRGRRFTGSIIAAAAGTFNVESYAYEGVSSMSSTSPVSGLRASAQEVARPRPQMLRESFRDLSGTWGFAHDDADRGLAEGWSDGRALPREITVPYPPESPASGIGE